MNGESLLTGVERSFRANGWEVFVAEEVDAARSYLLGVVGEGAKVTVCVGPAWRTLEVEEALTGTSTVVRCGPGLPVPPREAFTSADVGITGATALVVETASALIAADDAYGQLVSTLPYTHVVVAYVGDVVETLTEGLQRVRAFCTGVLGKPMCRYVAAVSGPSRTGDIEMIIVQGMHGPGKVHLILLDIPTSTLSSLSAEAQTA